MKIQTVMKMLNMALGPLEKQRLAPRPILNMTLAQLARNCRLSSFMKSVVGIAAPFSHPSPVESQNENLKILNELPFRLLVIYTKIGLFKVEFLKYIHQSKYVQ
jgi:hypothetical protein